jgi:signal transduction histidine kinase
MIRAMAVSLVFFAALAALGALFVARRVLRRIDAMNLSARAIMAGDMTRRLPVSGSDDELDRLALGLNEMLARISDLMAGMREVSDNIAHDLRTPLTRLRNHAEEALRSDADPAVTRAALERTIEESDGLIKIFNALLLIARAEAGAESAGMSAFDLGETVASVAELYAPLADEYGVALKVDAARGLTIVGNRELIGQAVANLIDNAVKYGAGEAKGPRAANRSEVAVIARRDGEAVTIEVADHGPGIPAADRARAVHRFVRLEGARSRPGSGLGLSLAAAVMRMHGGAVRLEDNAPGLKVAVTLPAAAPPLPPPPAEAAA